MPETSVNLERKNMRLPGSSWGPRCTAWLGRGWSQARGRYRRAGPSTDDARARWRQPCSRWSRSRSWHSDRATCVRTVLTSPEPRDRKDIRPWTPRCGSTDASHQAALQAIQPSIIVRLDKSRQNWSQQWYHSGTMPQLHKATTAQLFVVAESSSTTYNSNNNNNNSPYTLYSVTASEKKYEKMKYLFISTTIL